MAMRGGGFDRKSKTSSDIPSSSLADIAMLLLIFFMVTTVFRTDESRQIDFPSAVAAEKIDTERKNIVSVWMEKNGEIWLNDRRFEMNTFAPQVQALASGLVEQRMRVSLSVDRETPYLFVHQLQQELVAVRIVHVVFVTDLERRLQGVRR